MTAHGAVLVEPPPGWASTLLDSLSPGAHLFVVTSELAGIEGRLAGFELRDTVLVLSDGPTTRYAFLFRKPTEGATTLGQIIESRVGALNIASCRIGSGTDKGVWPVTEREGRASFNSAADGSLNRPVETDTTIGRWPTNVLLVHGGRCIRRGTVRVPSSQPRTRTKAAGFHPDNKVFGTGKGEFYSIGYGDDDGLETITFWECDASCSVKALDDQSGLRPSTLTGRADPTVLHDNPGDNNGTSLFGGGNSHVYADHGGASRFYPQFANDDEMIEWMKELIDIPQGDA